MKRCILRAKREATLKQYRNDIMSERSKPSFSDDTANKTAQFNTNLLIYQVGGQ